MIPLQAGLASERTSDAFGAATTRAVLAGTATAWLALGVSWQGALGPDEPRFRNGHATPSTSAVVDPVSTSWTASWLLMVIAMMWPLAVPAVGAVSRSSFRGWRSRLAIVCLATLTALWLVFGLVGALLARSLGVPTGSVGWQLAFVGIALAASRSARRSRVLEACLRLPALAPGGRRGVATAARAGVLTWRRCVVLCGPLMLAMSVGHSMVLMVCASLAAWWESWHPRAWHDRVPLALVAAGGLWLLGIEVSGGGLGHG